MFCKMSEKYNNLSALFLAKRKKLGYTVDTWTEKDWKVLY